MKKNSKSPKQSNKKKSTTVSKKGPTSVSDSKSFKERVKRQFGSLDTRRKDFLSRRPHRSFRRTKRRDYRRSLKIPGYIALVGQVINIIRGNKWVFVGTVLIYSAMTLILSNAISQDTYQQLADTMYEVSDQEDFLSSVPVLAIFWTVFSSQATGSSFGEFGSSQQIVGVLFSLFIWLSTVWLARSIMSGQKPRIRDGLYASGGPVVALMVLLFVLLIQLMPAAIALVAYTAAVDTGLLNQTAILMLFGGGTILLVTLSLYWAVGTLVAMVIVTLPGMYPFNALKLAGDLVVGRRLRILFRVIWLLLTMFVVWFIILTPTILLDTALKNAVPSVEWLPIVPIISTLLMSLSIVFIAMYVYVFYRRVVADETPPA